MSVLFRSLVLCLLLVRGLAYAEYVPDFGAGFQYAPSGTAGRLAATHVKVPGLGNYDATFKFNPQTLALELESATPSQTDENTESLAGLYTCGLYGGSTAMFSVAIRPAGHDLIFGGGVLYRLLGTSGSGNWKYTVSFADGGKYLLSIVKESTGAVMAYLGYLAAGKSELDLANTLQCERKSG